MKRITITLDEASLEQLEVLHYCFGASKSEIIRRSLDYYRDDVRDYWPEVYREACEKYRMVHSELYSVDDLTI